MGLTLIRKSRGPAKGSRSHVALVLAGGAVTGGAFKVGGIKALEDYLVGRGLCDLDTYVGLSAGAVLAVPLAGGITPSEMIRVLDGSSEKLDQLKPIDFYNPNFSEFISKPARFAVDALSYLPGVSLDLIRSLPGLPESAGSAFRRFIRNPGYTEFESLALRVIEHVSPTRERPSITDQFPSGIFENSSLERWLRKSLDLLGLPNDFGAFGRQRGSSLYLSACELDTAERVIFGADENSEVTISQAVQASTALPIFYKPARLNGIDYVDGGVRNTANIDVAIEKGADLIICYNPFRPFLNRANPEVRDPESFAKGAHLADRGLKLVLNQTFRTLLHSRLQLALQHYASDRGFQGDIILLEPEEHDADFFALNPMAFWHRSEAMQNGFESVRSTVEENFDALDEVLSHHGLKMSRKVAREQARILREEQGWASPRRRQVRREAPSLRAVGS
ncbi:MAG: hypothetical protein CL917_12280 [Deltaproteobacteria bacterium]|nr:hypothetical protein [Deltaproteobacteria bacterium]